MSRRKSKVVVILGMHRAGTSLLSRVINLLGVPLGQGLKEADEGNERGYWEHREIVSLNIQAIRSFGGQTMGNAAVLPYPAEWWRSEAVRKIADEIKTIVRRELDANDGLWGFKDPHTARLLPMWKQVFDDLDVDPIYLLAVRNPAEVAGSLLKRDETPIWRGELIWLEHYAEAIYHAGDRLKAVLSYEDWFRDPIPMANRTLRAMGLSWPKNRKAIEVALKAEITPELRHNIAVAGATAVSPLVESLYRDMLEAAASGDFARLFRRIKEYRRQRDSFSPVYRAFKTFYERAQSAEEEGRQNEERRRQLRQKLDEVTIESEDRGKKLEQSQKRVEQLKSSVVKEREINTGLRAKTVELDRKILNLDAALTQKKQHLATTRVELQETRRKLNSGRELLRAIWTLIKLRVRMRARQLRMAVDPVLSGLLPWRRRSHLKKAELTDQPNLTVGLDSFKRLDTRAIPRSKNEIRAFIACRNEAARLPWLLDYYRKMGVKRFIVVDNNSNDGTTDFLLSQPDTHVFHTDASYKESAAGMAWVNTLLDEYGSGHWCIVVDADEMLVFPHAEQITIADLCRYLDSEKSEALFCLFLDMYPSGALKDAKCEPGRPFLEIANYFDSGPYYAVASKKFPHLQVRGGPRQRIFWSGGDFDSGPSMKKIPLVKWRKGFRFTSSTHFMEPPVRLSLVTGALLHFKFFADFAEFVQREVQRGDRPGVKDYQAYHSLTRDAENFSLMAECSVRYRGTDQLLELGLIRTTWSLTDFTQKMLINKDAAAGTGFADSAKELHQRLQARPRFAVSHLMNISRIFTYSGVALQGEAEDAQEPSLDRHQEDKSP